MPQALSGHVKQVVLQESQLPLDCSGSTRGCCRLVAIRGRVVLLDALDQEDLSNVDPRDPSQVQIALAKASLAVWKAREPLQTAPLAQRQPKLPVRRQPPVQGPT